MPFGSIRDPQLFLVWGAWVKDGTGSSGLTRVPVCCHFVPVTRKSKTFNRHVFVDAGNRKQPVLQTRTLAHGEESDALGGSYFQNQSPLGHSPRNPPTAPRFCSFQTAPQEIFKRIRRPRSVCTRHSHPLTTSPSQGRKKRLTFGSKASGISIPSRSFTKSSISFSVVADQIALFSHSDKTRLHFFYSSVANPPQQHFDDKNERSGLRFSLFLL